MERVTVNDVPSRSYRGLEVFLLLPVLFTIFFAVAFGYTLAFEAESGAGDGRSVLLLGIFGVGMLVGLVSVFAIPVFLYYDAGAVADQELEWQPDRAVYVVFGLLFSALTVLHYLYKRHQYVVDRVDSEAWWYLVLGGCGLLVLATVGIVLNPSVFGLAFLGAAALAVGVYRDATYVRLNSDWNPNPVNHYLVALFTGVFGIVGVLYAGYYVYKRRSHLDSA